MTDKQPEALRLADALDSDLSAEWMQGITLKHISNELRRLHEENEAFRARLAQPEQESAYGYASRLATAIWEKHYKDESPHWKVNDSLLGVLTQIDNMTTGLVRAQPEQEPVAWITGGGKGELWWHQSVKFDVDGNLIGENPDDIPLYTAPPQREWQGLTDEEIREFEIWLDDEEEKHGWNPPVDIVKYIEQALKEKNT